MEKVLGGHFDVEIHDTYVIKTPKNKEARERMEVMALASELLKEYPEILPCELVDGKLYQPKARGMRCDLVAKNTGDWAVKEALKLVEKIKERHGIVLGDVKHKKNLFIKDGKIQIVDLSQIRIKKPA